MTSDSGLFRTADQLREAGYQQEGPQWVLPIQRPASIETAQPSHLDQYDGQAAPPDTYVPLYEAKMIHFFDHRFGSYGDRGEDRGYRILPETTLEQHRDLGFEPEPFYFVPLRLVNERLNIFSSDPWLVAFKDVTAATNERTAIFSFIPRVGVGHSAPLIFSSTPPREKTALIASLCSLVVDFCARSKVGGLHLTFFLVKQLPVLPPKAYSTDDLSFLSSRVLELTYTSYSMASFARDLGYDGPPFVWDEDRRGLLRAELDAWYARAYGLTRDELRYVLDPADVMGPAYPSETFRVLKNNETRKYGEYRTRRLVLDSWDRMEAGDLPAPVPYDRNKTVLDAAVSGVNPLFGAGPLFEVPEIAPVRPPTRVPIDPYRLPAASWAADSSLPAYAVTQLAAIIHRLSGPTPITQVRLASLLALEPHLLTRHLQGRERGVWLSLVGDAAQPPSANNVVVFASKINAAWGRAVTQLRGMGEIHEDLNAGTWAEGSANSQYQIPAWADGRADFVLRAVSRINFDVLTADLSSEDRAWVNIANVA
jgi:hypothetical protein